MSYRDKTVVLLASHSAELGAEAVAIPVKYANLRRQRVFELDSMVARTRRTADDTVGD